MFSFVSFPVICFFWFIFANRSCSFHWICSLVLVGTFAFVGILWDFCVIRGIEFTRHWKSRGHLHKLAGGSKHRTVKFADPCFITKPSVNSVEIWEQCFPLNRKNTWKPASFFASSPWPWYFGEPGEPLSPDFYRWWTPAVCITHLSNRRDYFSVSLILLWILQQHLYNTIDIYIYTHVGLHTYIYIHIHYIYNLFWSFIVHVFLWLVLGPLL